MVLPMIERFRRADLSWLIYVVGGIAALGALAGLLLVFMEPRLDHGYVIEKKHEPERTYTIWVPIKTGEVCSGYDTSRTCTPIYTPFPFQQFDDEDWKLKLEDGDKQGWLYVDDQTWRSTKIGDYIENGETSDKGNRRKPL